ncbi:hypothetical protein ACH0BF_24710 [Pseudobacillus sp. 179-B 2D1 NHS]|uniref:hypothetical protein n=1 Tax=Pseudobacillus sp. 179-B 2D1 NHS TaxID=3374292 RepID=UPI00387A7486
MNLVFIFIILFSLLSSTLFCFFVVKKAKKIHLIFYAFFMNAIILSGASAILYKIDAQRFHKELYGLFDSLGIVTLLFFIPIVTWFNIIIIKWRKDTWLT